MVNANEYLYLGHIKINKETQTAEMWRRVKLAWRAFGVSSEPHLYWKAGGTNRSKKKDFNTCILPVATYTLETMTNDKE